MAVYRFTGVRRVDREPNHVCIHNTIAPYKPSPGDYRQCDGVMLIWSAAKSHRIRCTD